MARGSRRGAREAAAFAALRRGEAGPPRPGGAQRVEDGYVVRPLPAGSDRTYRCPGCDQELRGTTPHVVVWPEGREDDRRHWHTPCWAARDRRLPRELRGRSAPRHG